MKNCLNIMIVLMVIHSLTGCKKPDDDPVNESKLDKEVKVCWFDEYYYPANFTDTALKIIDKDAALLPRFNISNYGKIREVTITYMVNQHTDTLHVELYNLTDGAVIEGSLVVANKANNTQYRLKKNISPEHFPLHDIDLTIRINKFKKDFYIPPTGVYPECLILRRN